MRVMGADTVIESIGIPYTRIVLCFTTIFYDELCIYCICEK